MADEIEKVEETTIESSEESGEEGKPIETPKEVKQDKPVETLEQKEARLARELKRTRVKLGKADSEEVEITEPKKTKSGGLDAGQKALALQLGLKKEELGHLQDTMQRTGYEMEELMNKKWFTAELEEKRTERTTTEADPSSSNRTGSSSADKVDYWLAKQQVPPADKPTLRLEYFNALIAKSGKSGQQRL